ncbi:MAG: hypothetical protein QM831_12650 [Kofleriaceae bacterium]
MDDFADALARADWGNVSRRLTLYAKRRMGAATMTEAEDVAAEAIRQVLDPMYRAWDPQRETLLWHLQSNVNGIVANRSRKKSRTQERLHDFQERPDVLGPTVAVDDEPDDSLLTLHAYAEDRGDQLACDIITQALQGVVSPKEVALSLGVPPQKVYDARQRLKRYGLALRGHQGSTE